MLCIAVLSVINFNLAGFPLAKGFGKARDLFFSLTAITLTFFLMGKQRGQILYLLFFIALSSVPIFIAFSSQPLSIVIATRSTYFVLHLCLAVLACNMLAGGRNFLIRFLSLSVSLLILTVPLTHLFRFCISGASLTSDTILALVQTNTSETLEYLRDNMGLGCIAFVIILAVIPAICLHISQKSPRRGGIVCLLLILSCTMVYKTRDNVLLAPFYSAEKGIKEYIDFLRGANSRIAAISLDGLTDQGDEGLFVFVIGESENRDNMHAYGYPRMTTPWLSSCKERENFILFTRAYSNHTHTVPTLSLSLTAKNQYNSLELSRSPSILDIANAAGYKTYWLSTQAKYGIYDTPTSIIASAAKVQLWINYTNNTPSFDGALLPQLKKLDFSSPKSFVIIHLMGSHIEYTQRYPKEFTQFGTTRLDTYDNSILYTDRVLQGIYEFFSSQKNFKALVYMSDHADAASKGLAHDSAGFDYSMTHIPFWVIFDTEYMKKNEDKFQRLKQNANTPFTNDLMFEFLLGIMDLNEVRFYDKKFDPGSCKFSLAPHQLKTLHGGKSLKEDPQLAPAN